MVFFFHVKVLTPSQMIDLKEAISTEIEEMYRKVSILHQTSQEKAVLLQLVSSVFIVLFF